jgi:hypothetical protein
MENSRISNPILNFRSVSAQIESSPIENKENSIESKSTQTYAHVLSTLITETREAVDSSENA